MNPPVSVITPVYNTEKYLAECIESVLAQTYDNWQYVIVDNVSTDRSREIAESYAAKDPRIKVIAADEHTEFVGNLNRSMRHIHPESKYCKVVHADDWLFPTCIEKMVGVAERHPSVGIVGAYCLATWEVKCDGIKYPCEFVDGRVLGRSALLGKLPPFGNPSCLLIRSDLIRERNERGFYNDWHFSVDTEACYELLQTTDFGFVHEVLTYERKHETSQTSKCQPLRVFYPSQLLYVVKYGRSYLSDEEYRQCLAWRLRVYRAFLVRSMFRKTPDGFWRYHREKLRDLGFSFSPLKHFLSPWAERHDRRGGRCPRIEGPLQ